MPNTSKRLSHEWNICEAQAVEYLLEAYRHGLVTRAVEDNGRSRPFVYSAVEAAANV
jgi:hypothetical protein